MVSSESVLMLLSKTHIVCVSKNVGARWGGGGGGETKGTKSKIGGTL